MICPDPLIKEHQKKGIKSGTLLAKKVHWDDQFLARKLE